MEQSPEDRVFGTRVTVPEFEIYSNPTIRISEVKHRRFNIIDRPGGRKSVVIGDWTD